MNKELSRLLRDKLGDLPFVDVLAGMAQTVTSEDVSEDGTKTVKRFPVSYDVLGVDCEGQEVILIPNSSRKSIIYFEDFGISSNGRLHGQTQYTSSLRLVCWMNRANLVGSTYQAIGGRVMASIVDELAGKNPENRDMFIRLMVNVARIPPQDAGIFGRYTYNETDRQYLRPPFEFFGIDLTCTYQVPAKCFGAINWNLQTCD
jgi:hypothetical protein